MMNRLKFFIFIALVSYSRITLAYDPTFGGEITLTNQKLITANYGPNGDEVMSTENRSAQLELRDAILKLCRWKKCEMTTFEDRYGTECYRFTFSDGWWFQLTLDPGVIEIQHKEVTAKEAEALEKRMQKFIFDAGASVNLTPHESIGGGHMHIGDKSAFEGQDGLFRDFMVDNVNHSEVVSGIFGSDPNNALPIPSLPERLVAKFSKLIRAFDSGKIPNRYELARYINRHVYVELPMPYPRTLRSDPKKYRASNVWRMDPDNHDVFPDENARTVEIRNKKPFQSARDFVLRVKMYDARLRLLRQQPRRLVLQVPKPFADTRVLPSDVERFQRYIGESNLNFADYQGYVPAEYVNPNLRVEPGVVPEARSESNRASWWSRLFARGNSGKSAGPSCQLLFAP